RNYISKCLKLHLIEFKYRLNQIDRQNQLSNFQLELKQFCLDVKKELKKKLANRTLRIICNKVELDLHQASSIDAMICLNIRFCTSVLCCADKNFPFRKVGNHRFEPFACETLFTDEQLDFFLINVTNVGLSLEQIIWLYKHQQVQATC